MKSGDRRPFGSRVTNEIVIAGCVTVTVAVAVFEPPLPVAVAL
jgi:hypothetical protein